MLNQTDLLRIFCVASEASSFREAAARLAISPQGVTRAIQQLERHFGEVLFHRSTRQVRVTEFGAQLAARGRDSLLQLDALFRRASDASESELPTRVRITAPRSLALAHPAIIVDLRLADAIADVVDEQIDIGVRLGFMRDNRFVARAVAKMSFVIAGAPALVARTGVPASPEALAALPTTGYIDGASGRVWPWYVADGLDGSQQFIPTSLAFLTDDPEAERDAVLAGVGYAQLPHYLVAAELASGRLVTVLDDFARPRGMCSSIARNAARCRPASGACSTQSSRPCTPRRWRTPDLGGSGQWSAARVRNKAAAEDTQRSCVTQSLTTGHRGKARSAL